MTSVEWCDSCIIVKQVGLYNLSVTQGYLLLQVYMRLGIGVLSVIQNSGVSTIQGVLKY